MMENKEIAVRDILNKEERAWIHSMGVDSQDIVYLLELQNSDKSSFSIFLFVSPI